MPTKNQNDDLYINKEELNEEESATMRRIFGGRSIPPYDRVMSIAEPAIMRSDILRPLDVFGSNTRLGFSLEVTLEECLNINQELFERSNNDAMSVAHPNTESLGSLDTLGSTNLRLGSSLENVLEEMDMEIDAEMEIEMEMVSEIESHITVTPCDILLGQSPILRAHPGNQDLRRLLEGNLQEYSLQGTTKTRKNEITKSIVGAIHKNGGRFLRRCKNASNKEWEEERSFRKQCDVVTSRFRGLIKCSSHYL